MPRRPKFTLTFAPEATGHLDAIERKHHSLIERAIDEQLSYTPEKGTITGRKQVTLAVS